MNCCTITTFSTPETLLMMGGAALITRSLYTMKRHKKRGAVELAIGVCAALGPFFMHILNPFLYPKFSISYKCNIPNCTETLAPYGTNNHLYNLKIQNDLPTKIGTIECIDPSLNCESILNKCFEEHKKNGYVTSYEIKHIKPVC